MALTSTHRLAHGNGGRFMRELIEEVFARHLASAVLDTRADAAPSRPCRTARSCSPQTASPCSRWSFRAATLARWRFTGRPMTSPWPERRRST